MVFGSWEYVALLRTAALVSIDVADWSTEIDDLWM